VALRLERPVVDRLRLGHLAVRPLQDPIGRREADADRVEIGRQLAFIVQVGSHVSPITGQSSSLKLEVRSSKYGVHAATPSLEPSELLTSYFSLQTFLGSHWCNGRRLCFCLGRRLARRTRFRAHQLDVQTQRLKLADEHVERLGQAGLER